MSDLISRADAIEAVCRTRCGDKAKGCPAHSCLVIEEFDALLSADAVQGEWIMHGEPPMYVIECSQCGQKYFNHALQEKANFCSNCGARMVKESDE